MKIGILPGTFDPIHNGHIHLAVSMLNNHSLDTVILVPTPLSPHKIDAPPQASAKDRLAMAKLAVEDIDKLEVSDTEIGQEGPCYTIDTVRKLISERGEHTYFLLLASDVLAGFDQWKEVSALLTLVSPLIGQRKEGKKCDLEAFSKKDREIIENGMTDTALLPVSSTQIRSALQKGSCVDDLVPAKVLDYICKHRLYCFT